MQRRSLQQPIGTGIPFRQSHRPWSPLLGTNMPEGRNVVSRLLAALSVMVLSIYSCPRASACNPNITPVQVIMADGFYAGGDKAASTIDRRKYTEYKKSTREVDRFLGELSLLSDRFVLNKDKSAKKCADDLLLNWARNGALTKLRGGSQSYFVLQWGLATMGLARMKLGPLRSPQQDRVVTQWLRKLAVLLYDFHASQKRFARNNHYYWATLAIGSVGYSTGSQDLWARSEAMFRISIKDIRPDGSLPIEMKRGPRALSYHSFAAQPLALYYLIAQRCRGSDLDIGNLRKLIALAENSPENRSAFQTRTGKAQIGLPSQGWIYIWKKVFDPDYGTLPKLSSNYTAGDIRSLYRVMNANCKLPSL